MSCELEVCTYSLESCVNAKKGGANRVELCTAMYDGGTTPSAATIRLARRFTHGMELYVMIRPRGGDFLYTDLEFQQMKEDLLFAREAGADGVVIGLLKADGNVDVERTRELVELAAPLRVTFHRAFDMTVDYRQALEDVIACGCYRILTSGLQNTVMEGIGVIEELVKQAQGRIQIMAGSGVSAANAVRLAQTGVNALHMSGKTSRDSAMIYRNPHVFMGGVADLPEYDVVYSDEKKIREVAEILKKQ